MSNIIFTITKLSLILRIKTNERYIPPGIPTKFHIKYTHLKRKKRLLIIENKINKTSKKMQSFQET